MRFAKEISVSEVLDAVENLALAHQVRADLVPLSVLELLERTFAVNVAAKWDYEQDTALYAEKEVLLREIVARLSATPDPSITWGLGYDDWSNPVLYFELAARGQVSFHVPMWEDDMLANLPVYQAGWTGERNAAFPPLNPLPRVHVTINSRDVEEFTEGELLDQRIRAGLLTEQGEKEIVEYSTVSRGTETRSVFEIAFAQAGIAA